MFWETIKRFYATLEGKLLLYTFLFHEIVVIALNTGLAHVPASTTDNVEYYGFATQIASLIRHGSYTWGAIYPYHWYPLFVGGVFSVIGNSALLGSTINAVLITVAAILLFRSMKLLGISEKAAFITALVAMNLYESLVLYTSILVKESWIVTLMVAMLYLSLKIIQSRKFLWRDFLIFLICFVLLRNLRYFMALAMEVGFFAAWFISRLRPLKVRLVQGILMLVVISVISFFLTGVGIGKTVSVFQYIQPSYISNLRTLYFRGGDTTTHIAVVVPVTAPSGDGVALSSGFHYSIKGILRSLANAALGPFPWQFTFKKYLLIVPEMIVWYLLWALGIIALVKKKNWNLVVLVPLVIIVGAMTFGVDNLGALLRYRIPVLVLVSILSAATVDVLLNKYKKTVGEDTIQ